MQAVNTLQPARADLLTTANTSRPAADAGRAGRHHDNTNTQKLL
jgi:hypothetical protein